MQRIWGWFYSEKCFFLPNKLADKEHACKRESWEIFYRFLTNLELLPHDSCAINCTEIRKEHLYIVKDKWNVSHDSLIHACSLSASWFGKKSTFPGIIILIFFACALRHCRVMTGYYVTLKYQAKPRTIAWKVFATLKWLDSTYFCLANNIIGLQALIPIIRTHFPLPGWTGSYFWGI